MKRALRLLLVPLFLVSLIQPPLAGAPALGDLREEFSSHFARHQAPEFLTFDELIEISGDPEPRGALRKKLNRLWTTPFISNEAYYRGVRAKETARPELDRFLRVMTWNMEKSLEWSRALEAFESPDAYQSMIDEAKAPLGSEVRALALAERDLLDDVNIILLQEMEIGVKRSGYQNVPKELAEALDMNYAYGAAYLEIDPAYLGLEDIRYEEGERDEETAQYFKVDPERYRGLFGSAVLSRYPIKSVTLFPLQTQGYDWYWQEREKRTFLEEARRFGAKTVFKETLHREMKVGHRHFMRVDLHVPGLPSDTLSVINIHLEIKCLPKVREEQMKEILGYIGKIRNPVIMAGDFNSAPGDLSPTSVTRTIKRASKNKTLWFSAAVAQLAPQALLVNTTRAVSNLTKNFQNPTARHVPVIAPNYVQGLFKAIQEFRFEDGYVFDFRGDPLRSANGADGLLANSNHRDRLGYKTTFTAERSFKIIAKYRLDWMFVKSFLTQPEDEKGPYRFAPHFGTTLEEFNTVLKEPVSDHHPCLVDLPFEEPPRAGRFEQA